jgi:hypothetical protein
MHEVFLSTGRDSLLVGVPLILLLLIGLFRLDEVFAKPKRRLKRRRPAYSMDEDGEPVLSDPDGRLSSAPILAGNQIGPRFLHTFILSPAAPPREPKIRPGCSSYLIDYKYVHRKE